MHLNGIVHNKTPERGRVKFTPIVFPTSGFETVGASEKLEEESLAEFSSGRFYPVNIGEIFASRYQVVGETRLRHDVNCVARARFAVCQPCASRRLLLC